MITRILSLDNDVILAKGQNFRKLGMVEKIVPAKNGKHYAVTVSGQIKIMSLDNWGGLVEVTSVQKRAQA